MLMQCLESLVQKLQGGVVINFEKYGPDPPPLNTEGNVFQFSDRILLQFIPNYPIVKRYKIGENKCIAIYF